MYYLSLYTTLVFSYSSTKTTYTLTSSKLRTHVDVARIPNLFSFLLIEKPGVSLSTMKHVIPLYPFNESMLD